MEQVLVRQVPARPRAELGLADLVLTVVITLGGASVILTAVRLLTALNRPLVQANRETVFLLLLLSIYLVFAGAIAVGLRHIRNPVDSLGLRQPSGREILLVTVGVVPWFAAEGLVVRISSVLFNGGQPLPTNTRDLFVQRPSGIGLLALALLVTAGLVPVCEEIFFRGMIYRFLRSRWPLWMAVGGSALLFALAHFNGRASWFLLLPVFAFMGTVLALVYEWTGSLTNSILLHGLNNGVLTLILFFVLSG